MVIHTNPTRHKLQEAEYFLKAAVDHLQDDDLFTFNMSACLSACRSVTFYMKKQYGRVDGFSGWYCARQIEMEADDELCFLNHARVESIHKYPVPVLSTKKVSASVDAYIVDPGSSVDNSSQATHSQENDQARGSIVELRRFLHHNETDAITFCRSQLRKLSKLVLDCEQQFLNKGELR